MARNSCTLQEILKYMACLRQEGNILVWEVVVALLIFELLFLPNCEAYTNGGKSVIFKYPTVVWMQVQGFIWKKN
jgi:hypothetical protein